MYVERFNNPPSFQLCTEVSDQLMDIDFHPSLGSDIFVSSRVGLSFQQDNLPLLPPRPQCHSIISKERDGKQKSEYFVKKESIFIKKGKETMKEEAIWQVTINFNKPKV